MCVYVCMCVCVYDSETVDQVCTMRCEIWAQPAELPWYVAQLVECSV